MGDDDTAGLSALRAGLTARQLLVSLVRTVGQGTLTQLLSPSA